MTDWLIKALFFRAESYPTKNLGVFGDVRLTYGQVAELVERGHESHLTDWNLPSPLTSLVEFFRRRYSWRETVDAYCASRNVTLDGSEIDFIDAHPGEFLPTSGSTGSIKSVYVTFAAQAITASSINSLIIRDESQDELLLLPMNFSSGAGRVRAAILRGATLYLAGSPFRPKNLVAASHAAPDLALGLTPATWRLLKQTFRESVWDLLAQVRSLEFGSAVLGQSEIDELCSHLGSQARLMMHYGLTEASRSFLRDLTLCQQEGAIGNPMPHTDFRLQPVDDGRGLQLEISGPHTASLIHRDRYDWQEISEESPWVATGDVVERGQESTLVLVGRQDDLFSVGGKLVSPARVESVIRRLGFDHDFVVVGRSHALLGHELICVVNQEHVDHLRQRLVNIRQHLEPHEVPSDIVALPRLPQLESMKLDRVSVLRLVSESK